MNRLIALALIVAGSFVAPIVASSFALAEPTQAEKEKQFRDGQNAKQAYERLQKEIDTFAKEWRRGLDDLSHDTSSEELTVRTNALWPKHVHFQQAACVTKNDGLKIREYLKDAAERQGILTQAPRSSTVAMFQIDSNTVDCKNNQITGKIIFLKVRYITVTYQ